MSRHEPVTPQETVNGVRLNATPGVRPVLIDGCDTLPRLFEARCRALGARTAHREKHLGIWRSYSWSDYWDHARWIGLGLRRLGLAGLPAYVTRHGDDTAGSVMVKCATLDGRASLWIREWDFETDRRAWLQLNEAEERIGRLTLVHADRVEMKPLNPLWPGRIYIGKLTTLAGVPDQGKSLVTCDIAARVTRGMAWPDDSGIAPKGTVIFLAAEDDKADTIVPRLAAAGADLSKVKILNSLVLSQKGKSKSRRTFSIAEDIAELTKVIRRYPDTRVLFVDPTNAYMGTSKETDSFRDSDVRAVLGPLKEWAEEHSVAVVLVTHFKKGGTGTALDQVMGSLAFVALSRSSWAFLAEKGSDGEPTGRKLLARIKQNITKPVDALACHIEGVELGNGIAAPKMVWEEEVEGDANMFMSGGGGEKLSIAKAFLLGTLAEGPVKASEVRADAENSGIAKKTLERAKKELGIGSVQKAGAWYWHVEGTEVPVM